MGAVNMGWWRLVDVGMTRAFIGQVRTERFGALLVDAFLCFFLVFFPFSLCYRWIRVLYSLKL